MNISVLLFFAHNVLATVLLGGKFASKSDAVFRFFGIGLLLDAFAFAMWTIGYVNSGQLLTFVTFGAVAFLVSLEDETETDNTEANNTNNSTQ